MAGGSEGRVARRSGAPLWFAIATIVLGMPMWPARCEPWDWHDAPFPLRVGLAVDRVSATYTDIVALSASAAYPSGSSVNPANDDMGRDAPNAGSYALTGSGVYIPFATRGSVATGSVSVGARLPGAGTLSLAYSRTESSDVISRQGDAYAIDAQDLSLRYGRRLTPWLSVGGEFRFSESTVDIRSRPPEPPAREATDSTAYDLRFGGTVELTKELLLAVVAGAGLTFSDTRVDVADAGGSSTFNVHTFTRAINLRAGAGWRPSETLGLYADLQYLRLWTDESSVSVARVLAGAEYQPIQGFVARVGTSIDTTGASTFSAGLGYYPSNHVFFDVAYVYNVYPELRHEFGRSQLFSAALTLVY